MTQPNGWLILDKPVGLGSTQAVGAVKRNLREAGYGKVKTGHGGTLDPLASGVLPIALGEATKLAGRMLDGDKVYEFTVHFGAETDTLDLEGTVVAQSDIRPTLAAVDAVMARFTGAIEQVPPAFSALMVEGRRAYDLARAGEEVALPARAVTIHSLTAGVERSRDTGAGTSTSLDTSGYLSCLSLTAHVSKGTYIRSLARDFARALGTVGHVTYLRRIRAGPFGLDAAISLDMLEEIGKGARLENSLLPLEAGLDGIPALDLGPEQARAVHQGRVLTGLAFQDGVCWARYGDRPLALLQVAGGNATVLRGFNLPDTAE
ncbi:tRNA pseudouridine(55) synthase TruB [Novosphingobium sp. Gsoil 351]|uniref:tRNA pseudouridine(55) synthase TruB n=1 Tax=Novosphingobium sp. Gsoil 351 TaxID=2675225 RepID=UPI0012B46ABA|nr:tRNA pseudouridine(55) synthase TruB [Novosphingobium sp. Gsoil 351]QGN55426.1 tRNA pseudouridine(55) synthase TruB [Novosphingobium sp. Gsoil 351]